MSALELNWQRIHERLRHYRRLRPSFADMIIRRLYHLLHERGFCHETGLEDHDRDHAGDPNRPAPPTERSVLETWNRTVLDLCQRHLKPHEVVMQLQQAEGRESIRNLIRICETGTLCFDDLHRAVKRFCWIPQGETLFSPQEESGARASLIRNLLSEHIPFVQQAKKVLTIRRFGALIRRIIGPEEGMGRLGGTISGLLYIHALLTAQPEDDPLPVHLPRGNFLRSDALKRFLAENQLDEYMFVHYCPQEVTEVLYPVLVQSVTAGSFSAGLEKELRRVLRELQGQPISLIPSGPHPPGNSTPFDRNPRQVISAEGSEDERLQLLCAQLKQMFAASLSPENCHQRENSGVQDSQDRIAVFLAVVPGTETPGGFLPSPELVVRIEPGGNHHWEFQAGGNPLSQPALFSRQTARMLPIIRGKKQPNLLSQPDRSGSGRRTRNDFPGYQQQGERFILDPASGPVFPIRETQITRLARCLHEQHPEGATLRFACHGRTLILLEALF